MTNKEEIKILFESMAKSAYGKKDERWKKIAKKYDIEKTVDAFIGLIKKVL